jgi:ankyrin repeat protein
MSPAQRKRLWETGAAFGLVAVLCAAAHGYGKQRGLNEALADALRRRSSGDARLMLRRGADPNTRVAERRRDRHGARSRTVLELAVSDGDAVFVREALDRGVNPNGLNGYPLRRSALYGRWDIVEQLAARGVELTGDAGAFALLMALLNEREATARLLLKRGANPNARLTDGQTALHIAKRNCSPGLVRALKAAGARN